MYALLTITRRTQHLVSLEEEYPVKNCGRRIGRSITYLFWSVNLSGNSTRHWERRPSLDGLKPKSSAKLGPIYLHCKATIERREALKMTSQSDAKRKVGICTSGKGLGRVDWRMKKGNWRTAKRWSHCFVCMYLLLLLCCVVHVAKRFGLTRKISFTVLVVSLSRIPCFRYATRYSVGHFSYLAFVLFTKKNIRPYAQFTH